MPDQPHTSPITKQLIAEIRDQFRITWDGHHGAPHWARMRHRGVSELDDAAFALLTTACNGHSDGHMNGDITVQVCWDSDRLDLGRVGIKPDPLRLCTQLAHDADCIECAWQWGLAQYHGLKSARFAGSQEEGTVREILPLDSSR